MQVQCCLQVAMLTAENTLEDSIDFSEYQAPNHPGKFRDQLTARWQIHMCTAVLEIMYSLHTSMSSCGKPLGILSDPHCEEVGGKRPLIRTNNRQNKAYCSKFPRRELVYIPLTKNLSGTFRFRILTETISFRIHWHAEVT